VIELENVSELDTTHRDTPGRNLHTQVNYVTTIQCFQPDKNRNVRQLMT